MGDEGHEEVCAACCVLNGVDLQSREDGHIQAEDALEGRPEERAHAAELSTASKKKKEGKQEEE